MEVQRSVGLEGEGNSSGERGKGGERVMREGNEVKEEEDGAKEEREGLKEQRSERKVCPGMVKCKSELAELKVQEGEVKRGILVMPPRFPMDSHWSRI